MGIMEIYSIVVAKMGINPEYFFKKMKLSEVQIIVTAYYEQYKERLELSRLIGISAVAAFAGQPIKFDWDTVQTNNYTPEVEEEIFKTGQDLSCIILLKGFGEQNNHSL